MKIGKAFNHKQNVYAFADYLVSLVEFAIMRI